MNAFELKNVTFQYEGADKPVLTDASFYGKFGEVTLLAGYSGDGKSTILELLCGIIPNSISGTVSGEIEINGKSILGEPIGKICRDVSIVLQNADEQILHQTVEDEIAFGCENFGFAPKIIDQKVRESCDLMELDPQWKPRMLSGGQKQRLITASSLATGQKVLLLDEPLANLDRQGAAFLVQTLTRLAHKLGYAILIVEHRIDAVLPYIDTIWRISNGKLHQISKEAAAEQTEEVGSASESSQWIAHDNPLLELKHIRFKARKREILKDVSFPVYRGEKVLILGENGCGKTTLLRCIAKLNPLSGGRIEQALDPKFSRQKKGTKDWYKHVGMVYQNPNYQLFMPSVYQEIYFGCHSEEKTESILRQFRLKDIRERHPASLSEGQKRRVSVAAILAGEPDILLLDEPTVGQDYENLEDLMAILNEDCAARGTTLITITHDKRCVRALCDHAFLLQDGVISEDGDQEFAYHYFCS